MKYLKYIIIIFSIILTLPFILGLFVDKDIHVEREILINQPKQEVFDYIKQLRNHPNFSKWAKMDPNADFQFTGKDGEVGSVYLWESENKSVGKGAQEIIAIEEGKRIDYELRFEEPFESTDYAYLTTEAVNPSETRVKWGFESTMDYPLNFMLLFMQLEETIGNDFQEGLDNLKQLLEE